MWLPERDRLIKVRLHSNGEDVETPWAEDLGPVRGRKGARRVRIANVPFLHSKPTYEDVIVVEPDPEDGFLTWDRTGAAWEEIETLIDENSGRWAMIVDYRLLRADADLRVLFSALDHALEQVDVALEGCYSPQGEKPGRAYLAVPRGKTAVEMMNALEKLPIPIAFKLIHPVDEDE